MRGYLRIKLSYWKQSYIYYSPKKQVSDMIEGQYSNYVLQKMMDTAPQEMTPALMEVLR